MFQLEIQIHGKLQVHRVCFVEAVRVNNCQRNMSFFSLLPEGVRIFGPVGFALNNYLRMVTLAATQTPTAARRY